MTHKICDKSEFSITSDTSLSYCISLTTARVAPPPQLSNSGSAVATEGPEAAIIMAWLW